MNNQTQDTLYILAQPGGIGDGNTFTITSNIYSFINPAIQIAGVIVITLSVVVAFVGLLKLVGNFGGRALSDFKDTLSRVFLAVLLVASLVAVFVFLNKDAGKAAFSGLGVVGNAVQRSVTTSNTSSVGSGLTVPAGDRERLFQVIRSNDDSVYKRLTDGKIIIKNNFPCTKLDQKECTSLGGMREETIQMLLRLRSLCDCTITVTGGTEFWLHGPSTQHKPGGRAVDMAVNPVLNNVIQKTFTPQGVGACGPRWVWGGFTFCLERSGTFDKTTGDHWHVE